MIRAWKWSASEKLILAFKLTIKESQVCCYLRIDSNSAALLCPTQCLPLYKPSFQWTVLKIELCKKKTVKTANSCWVICKCIETVERGRFYSWSRIKIDLSYYAFILCLYSHSVLKTLHKIPVMYLNDIRKLPIIFLKSSFMAIDLFSCSTLVNLSSRTWNFSFAHCHDFIESCCMLTQGYILCNVH